LRKEIAHQRQPWRPYCICTLNPNFSSFHMYAFTASFVVGACLALWFSLSFSSTFPPSTPIHSASFPATMTIVYLLLIPLLKRVVAYVDADKLKNALTPSVIAYNVFQVAINGYIVYDIIYGLLFRGHPFVGDVTSTDCCFAVYLHYCNKYLEFFDTIFMVLRGRLDQVSFLHVYHHTTIVWAWYWGVRLYIQGDSYFGALLNSIIHVFMYSYYAMSLLKMSCPWKRYLTIGQLTQFCLVVVYTALVIVTNYRKGQLELHHLLACAIQVGEMVSLFLLFSVFYKRTYNSSGSNGKGSRVKDECEEAVTAGVKRADAAVSAVNELSFNKTSPGKRLGNMF